jgi:hypothetical protein
MTRIKTGGRTAGTPNKVTSEIREAFQSLVEGNLSNIETWLEATAEKDPAKALDFMLKLSDYLVPKLKAVQLSTGLSTDIHVTFPKQPENDEAQ